jgi:hypothetical protein
MINEICVYFLFRGDTRATHLVIILLKHEWIFRHKLSINTTVCMLPFFVISLWSKSVLLKPILFNNNFCHGYCILIWKYSVSPSIKSTNGGIKELHILLWWTEKRLCLFMSYAFYYSLLSFFILFFFLIIMGIKKTQIY